MTTYINAILMAIKSFPIIALFISVPMIVGLIIKYKAVNVLRISLGYAALLYGLCLAAVVFFPLPTKEQAAALHGYQIQLVPLQFVADIVKQSPFRINDPATYLECLYDSTVLQVVLNIVMTIPFGAFLRYCFKMDAKKVVLITAAVSLFIEITQLTGIYGIYNGSYRLCDVDDLMTNTLGGYLGFRMIESSEWLLPRISEFDIPVSRKGHAANRA